jgi:hypothetical protein
MRGSCDTFVRLHRKAEKVQKFVYLQLTIVLVASYSCVTFRVRGDFT